MAQTLYLDLLVARGYGEQVPASQAARGWHLLWLLVPVFGPLLFAAAVKRAGRHG